MHCCCTNAVRAHLHRQAGVLQVAALLVLCAAGSAAARDVFAPMAARQLLSQNEAEVTTPPLPSYPCRTVFPNSSSFLSITVDPRAPRNVGDGSTRTPFASFPEAWASLPRGRLTRGVLINIVYGGIVGAGNDPLWMEGVWGTATAPVVVQRAPGVRGSVDLQSINVYNCTHLYFKSVMFRQAASSDSGGDVVHFASSKYIYMQRVGIIGLRGEAGPHEALKVNQVQGMYIEDSEVANAGDNAIDFVAVQYGHVCRTKVHDANWCFYVKGGSAYLLLDANWVYNCRESGLRVGQGTGFEYMTHPWLQYEGYGVVVTNNFVHNVWGAALGISGGYNVLMAHNTVYNAGQRSHMVEILYGSRSCDGDESLPGVCARNAEAGGWGPTVPGDNAVPIPNANILFLNNLLINPSNRPSQYTHFMAPAQATSETPGRVPGMPDPKLASNLLIAGNVFINRRTDGNPMDIGLDACSTSDPDIRCTLQQVLANNTFNPTSVPGTPINVTSLRPTPIGQRRLRSAWRRADVTSFPSSWTTPLPTPPGTMNATVPFDAVGRPRTPTQNLVGADTGFHINLLQMGN